MRVRVCAWGGGVGAMHVFGNAVACTCHWRRRCHAAAYAMIIGRRSGVCSAPMSFVKSLVPATSAPTCRVAAVEAGVEWGGGQGRTEACQQAQTPCSCQYACMLQQGTAADATKNMWWWGGVQRGNVRARHNTPAVATYARVRSGNLKRPEHAEGCFNQTPAGANARVSMGGRHTATQGTGHDVSTRVA